MATHAKHHDYHLVDPSPWPVAGATSAFIMAIGAIVWMKSLGGGSGLLGLHGPALFIFGFGWGVAGAAGATILSQLVTLGLYAWAIEASGEAKAMTLAFTTFVLFQFFNIFNARAEHGSAFNRQFFANGKLWLALAGVVLLQIVAVHWAPAQVIFDTVDLSLNEWLLATAVASSVLFIEELRKLLVSLVCRSNTNATTGHER